MQLNRSEVASRLKNVDYRLAMDMRCPIMDVSAHRTKDEASRGANPITSASDASEAWFYRVSYHIKTLVGEDRYSQPVQEPVVVLIDLNAHGNYPFTRPESYVIGSVVPWSPHFARGVPVCFEVPGRVWLASGKTTLGHLLLHLARLINFDEYIGDPRYGGYNAAAVAFWRSVLREQPITPDLAYPVLPAWFFGAESTMTLASASPIVVSGPKSATVIDSARATATASAPRKAAVVKQAG